MAVRFLVAWFVFSSIVCTWDAGFVLLRPHSLPLGDLELLWKPYSLYIEVDTRYADMEDEFVIAQSWCNLLECLLNIVTVFLLLQGRKAASVIGFLVTVMTLWKTVIYCIQYTPLCTASQPLGHLSWAQLVMLFLVPNGIWLVVPFYVLVHFGRQLLRAVSQKEGKGHEE